MTATNNSSRGKVNSPNDKGVVTANCVRSVPPPAGSNENPRGDETSRSASSDMSSINTLNDKQVGEQALGVENSETFSREEGAILTPIGDVHYHVCLSTKCCCTKQDYKWIH